MQADHDDGTLRRERGVADSNARPICEFPQGAEVVIQHVCGCDRSRGRLCSMGLTPGTKVTLLSSVNGSCRLRVRDADLALGHRMAAHTMAVPAESFESGKCIDEDLGSLSRFLESCRRCWRERQGNRHGHENS